MDEILFNKDLHLVGGLRQRDTIHLWTESVFAYAYELSAKTILFLSLRRIRIAHLLIHEQALGILHVLLTYFEPQMIAHEHAIETNPLTKY